MHQAGAAELTEYSSDSQLWLSISAPFAVLAATGRITVGYYLCPRCKAGQFPADVELNVEDAEFSLGVHRKQAFVLDLHL